MLHKLDKHIREVEKEDSNVIIPHINTKGLVLTQQQEHLELPLSRNRRYSGAVLRCSNDLYLKPRFPTGAQWYSVHCTDCKRVLLITLTCTPLYNDYRKPWKKDATGISALVEVTF